MADHPASMDAIPDVIRPGKMLRIGELAKLTGKSVRALHLYEECNILRPADRSTGGFRLYHPSSVERVDWISKLQEAGFSLSELKELLKDVLGESIAPDAMSRLRGVFETKLAETRHARSRLNKLEHDLEAALSYLDGCRSCAPTHNPGKDCPSCHINGHESTRQPTLVAGIHQS